METKTNRHPYRSPELRSLGSLTELTLSQSKRGTNLDGGTYCYIYEENGGGVGGSGTAG